MNDDEKKQLIYDLSRYRNKIICVKFVGGREIVGKLVNFDSILNLVLVKPKNKEKNDSGLKWDYGQSVICLGGSIISISLGRPQKLTEMS